ncbi:MAG: hypothetical protein EXS55_02715 [Candidatus Magasanikbacteria bacterium]|nr:hypothetical protein [Candidatus Magasanikbacteria bacterium]
MNKSVTFKIITSLSLVSLLFFNIPQVFAEEASVSSTSPLEAVVTSTRELIAEPAIRVGLYKSQDGVSFVSDSSYQVFSGVQLFGALAAGDTASLSYTGGLYHFNSSELNFDSPHFFRLAPEDATSFFTITNYNRRLSGRKNNFNTYRGALEYRFSPKSKLPYIINELPLDSYVAGIAESSDSVPTEYAKALLVAARSYAYAMLGTSPSEKHLFDVYATTQDQLYLGYNSEISMPNIAATAHATAGQMVTHQGKPVVTPYFSHSNGKTKTWPSKTRPWLKSVVASYDKGKKMLGHGYGMSNRDASLHAGKDGWTYDEILKHYYSGTEVEKIY